MMISAEKIQNWCNQNISPVSWQRVVIKSLPQLREYGFELSDLMNPSPTLQFPEGAFSVVASSVEELYQTQIVLELVLA